MEKIKSDRLFTMVSGSLPPPLPLGAARAGTVSTERAITSVAQKRMALRPRFWPDTGLFMFQIPPYNSSMISTSSKEVKVKSRSPAL